MSTQHVCPLDECMARLEKRDRRYSDKKFNEIVDSLAEIKVRWPE